MQRQQLKTFHVDGDLLTVLYLYDEHARMFIGQFPDFDAEPRFTPNGRPWMNAVSDSCPYATDDYGDCGSCPYLIKEDARDIIGVCFHEKLRSRASPGEAEPTESTGC